ncbi:MAG: PQQ-binding-like beta-propeller repeat protein, partial [Planctomycetaceae bacterium]|nr:PQQ-binding-like beta-propeller repeat protein [Planctomycetaceae bacterium]
MRILCVLVFCLSAVLNLSVVEGGQLLSARQMERFGLVRVWYNQLPVNERSVKLQSVMIEGNTLFAVSGDAKIHAIDTATGKLLWSRVMGKRELQYRTPAANSRVVAVVNNIELFIFDRKTGKLLFYVPLPNSVSVTSCEISENYIYIPMLGGRIIVYPLEEGVAEKTFNVKTGEYEDTIPTVIKPPASNNKTDQTATDKTKDKALAMKAVVDGDLDKRDEVVAGIVESFAITKHSILAKPEVPPKEPQLVLRPPLNIPMSTISFGDLTIQPKLSSQILKADPLNPNNDKAVLHWEILTWINKDGDFHASVIRDLSKTKIEQLYKISSPTKAFRPEINQIAERDWNIGKQVVVRPATNQTVPYFYSATNVDDQFIQDLSVVGTKSGYVYAIKNRNGEVLWHFVANGSVVEQMAVIGVDVFVPTLNGMHDIDVRRGKEKWFVPNIVKFICASRSRVYVQDKNGFLVILDRKSGGRIVSLDLRKFREVLFNVETDRLFIIDDSGLIQCFAERQA